MTEYDFSPEAYERYLATQVRIANWVDKTEQHRSQFEHAIQQSPPRSASPPARPNQPASYHRSKRSPPPAMNHQGHHPQQFQQPRQLYIHPPSPASESSDDYGDGPGPMPLTSPGIVFPQQQQQHHQHPAAYHPVPMMPHAPMVVPQTYMTVPHHKSSSHHRRRSPHSRSHSHNVQGYYGLPSPPVSPGYQYGYPQMIGGHPGYMVMQPQPPRAMPYMSSDLPPPPRSAPANVTSFSLPTSPGVPQLSNSGGGGSYFQATVPGQGSQTASFTSPIPPGVDAWSYGVASPSHSAMSASTETGTFAVIMTTPSPTQQQQTHYFASIPQYQGIHSAMASPPSFGLGPNDSRPSYSNNFLYVPPALHENAHAYDFTYGRGKQHYLRRSIG